MQTFVRGVLQSARCPVLILINQIDNAGNGVVAEQARDAARELAATFMRDHAGGAAADTPVTRADMMALVGRFRAHGRRLIEPLVAQISNVVTAIKAECSR